MDTLRHSGGALVECGTCNRKVVGLSPALSKVPSFSCSKKYGPRQGRVRRLALRASLESVGDSDPEQVAWLLYKCEVPPVCIHRVTGDKGVKRISLHTLGTPEILPQGFAVGCFNYPLGEVLCQGANLQQGTTQQH